MKSIFIFLAVAFCACKPASYQFKQGQILLPDYVCTDTLICTSNFNMPAGLASDAEIINFLKNKTIKK
jgi:hypothetical protein